MSNGISRAILVGAYERENFGDLLFLLRTREYLADTDVIPTAPFASGASEYLDEEIRSYVPELRSGSADGVWIVGGEVGSTTLSSAFRLSASEEQFAAFSKLQAHDRAEELGRIFELPASASPYLPRASAFPRSHGTSVVINSVGLGGIRGMHGDRLDEVRGAIRDANFVSVRDRPSSDLLRKLSIQHMLAPDLVQTLALDREYPRRQESDLALVQVKEKVLQEFGTEAFAEVLSQSKVLKHFRIRLFLAGSARGHDSYELCQQVAQAFQKIAPSREISISDSLRPMDKVREISECGLWIGTSLHGLIVSSAFDVPRVALELEKLSIYARTWEETMPFGVALKDLDAAAESALLNQEASVASGRARELGRLADASAVAARTAMFAPFNEEKRSAARAETAASIERSRRRPSRRLWRSLRPAS